MGKVKVKIERLEKKSARQVTYSKRRAGILKKAKEISVLCDTDISLVMFSPTGKPSVCLGERSNMEEVVGKFARLSIQERDKRKLEGMEVLKKSFQKSNHEVNIEEYLGSSTVQIIENLSEDSKSLETEVEDTHTKLSRWRDPDEIGDMEHLKIMEESLRKSLEQVFARKENFPKPVMPLECPNQFENEIQLPPSTDEEQQMAWLHDNNVGQNFFSEDMEPLLQSNIDCTTGNSIPLSGGYPCYFSTEGQFDSGTQQSMVSTSAFDQNAYLSDHQLSKLPCQQYGLSSLCRKRLMSKARINIPNDIGNYQINGFELPKPSFGTTAYDWASASTSQMKEHNDQLQIEAQREQTQLKMNARSQMLSQLMTILQAPLPSCSNRWRGPKHDDYNPGAGGQGRVT